VTASAAQSSNRGRFLGWMLFSLCLVAADQITKYWISSVFDYGESVRVTDFFNLVLAYNTGAAFSIFADAGGWQRIFFTAFALLAVAVLSVLIRRKTEQSLLCLGFSLILSGAVGNAIDRIMLGHVIDFLDFHWMGYHWPAFNVADICICLGAAVVLSVEFFGIKR
jgi:signal peptidase II